MKESFFSRLKRKINFGYLTALFISLAVALLIGAGILAVSGHNPIVAYRALLGGAFSNWRHVGDMLEYAMVLCLCGLACDIGSRVGIFNVGGEGQLLLGAIFAAQIGVWFQAPYLAMKQPIPAWLPWLAIPCAALGAMAVGGLYAFIPGVLKVKLKVNEVITTIMLNTVAVFLCQFLAKGPWKNADKNIVAGTGNLTSGLWLTKLVPGSNLSSAILISAVLTFLVWYILQKTTKGYEMRLTGDNPRFARYAGLKTDRIVIVTMIISGMMCGLVGMFRVYGAEHIYKSTVSNEYYFEGLMVAMIAQYQPLPTVIISLIFAVLKNGAMGMETAAGVPKQLYLIIQTVVIFCMAAETGIRIALIRAKERRRAAQDVKARKEGGAAHE